MGDRKMELPILGDFDSSEHDHPEVARESENGVSIRFRYTGVAIYAVYDGETQVSDEVGPIHGEELLWWYEGYIEAKRITEAMLDA